MSKIICFHHNDLDGLFAAGVVKHFYNDNQDIVDFVEVNYGNNFEKILSKVKLDDYIKCVIVDFAFPKEIMEKLFTFYGTNMIWIDHHITQIETMPKLNVELQGVRDINYCGCVLTWKYFFPDKTLPVLLDRVQDLDLWIWTNPDSKILINGLHQRIKTPELAWYVLTEAEDSDFYSQMMEIGNILIEAQEKRVKKGYESGTSVEFRGFKTRLMNSNSDQSQLGNYACKQGYDIGLIWFITDKKISFGLRSEGDVDVGTIAKEYGGGGHKNASGFELPIGELDFINKLMGYE